MVLIDAAMHLNLIPAWSDANLDGLLTMAKRMLCSRSAVLMPGVQEEYDE